MTCIIATIIDNNSWQMEDYHHYDEVWRSSQGHPLFLGDVQAAEDLEWLKRANVRTGTACSLSHYRGHGLQLQLLTLDPAHRVRPAGQEERERERLLRLGSLPDLEE